ncbi:light-harvesting complex-like protein OHP1, chloroplastic [Phoenix dactylifera]|uniref:Light-harvesting complex-like protein OHP1, chloroplastic n=1 Tax=Phoenix dactylifera TaxID=42345 RepID=A0A8B8J947_PHODC|nr:light-harvesting complex-like protein OHP1, chloroplastic [Phoenix dactylifera]XP_026663723.2 light-harvesting complex-like protein OHP1, chloroplastic [Phoenix dactylifera]
MANTQNHKNEREREREMAAIPTISSPFLQQQSLCSHHLRRNTGYLGKQRTLRIRAARLPAGVEVPKVEPKLTEPFLGFTKTAEIWNSRACMIGIIGIFIVELVFHKGLLQMIGVDVGKGLDLPL